MRSYRQGAQPGYDLKVHLVWITTYRYKVLTKEVGLRIRELIRQVWDANGIEMLQKLFGKKLINLQALSNRYLQHS